MTNEDIARVEYAATDLGIIDEKSILDLCAEVRRLQEALRLSHLQQAEAREAASLQMLENARLLRQAQERAQQHAIEVERLSRKVEALTRASRR